jgi:LacI family transcriptional regulator
MATVKDIAAVVGVSVATVSNVLNGRPNVGRSVRQKVLRAAQRLAYRPNRAAQAMRTGRTRAIGLVLPDLTNPFFPQLAQAVESTARSLGMAVCLIDSQGSATGEADGFVLLLQHAVDGIIWCPVGPRRLPHEEKHTPPIVLIDRPQPGYPVVHSNYVMGGGLLAAYAVRMGHRRVALLSGPQQLASARQRRDGFVKALPAEVEIAWEVCVGFDGVLGREAHAALARLKKATLIVAGNDLIAISAIRVLSDRGMNVPEDISITGFDDISWADVVRPRLTTIAQPLDALGARAVELLQACVTGAKIAPRRTVIDVALIERESVRRLSNF